MKGIHKRAISGIPCLLMAALSVGLGAACLVVNSLYMPMNGLIVLAALLLAVGAFIAKGLYSLDPNQAAVITFFGNYKGTVSQNGLLWNFPLYQKQKVSQRIQNFESHTLKVNDLEGSPINIAAIVVWQVADPAEAVFNVQNYMDFVMIQAESALRVLASAYRYDSPDEVSLRSHPEQIAHELQTHIAERLETAGINVVEARISHLAYSAEIAQAMLQRQQAQAIVEARARIVSGAVAMVEDALQALDKSHQVNLDDDRKAQMVTNLLAVLCSDKGTQPVINSGSSS